MAIKCALVGLSNKPFSHLRPAS